MSCKLLNFSVPQFPHLSYGDSNDTNVVVVRIQLVYICKDTAPNTQMCYIKFVR